MNMFLCQILAYIGHGKILKSHTKNNKFKISAPMWNDKFKLPDGSQFV